MKGRITLAHVAATTEMLESSFRERVDGKIPFYGMGPTTSMLSVRVFSVL
jgi:hypothetical protein